MATSGFLSLVIITDRFCFTCDASVAKCFIGGGLLSAWCSFSKDFWVLIIVGDLVGDAGDLLASSGLPPVEEDAINDIVDRW